MLDAEVRTWLDAARERTMDTDALLCHRGESTGTVYMAGYVIELHLKALWLVLGKRPPRTHCLSDLWKGAGYRMKDLDDKIGAKAFFFTRWDTSLRYAPKIETRLSVSDLVVAAKQIAGQILTQVRRESEKRSRRGR